MNTTLGFVLLAGLVIFLFNDGMRAFRKETGYQVMLRLRLVPKEAQDDSVVTLQKFVFLRMQPAIGFTISGQGFDTLPIERIELESSDEPGWVMPAVCAVHLKDCKIETARMDSLVKSMTSEQGWLLLAHQSTYWDAKNAERE